VDALRADVFQTLDKQRAAIAALKHSSAEVAEWRGRVDAAWRDDERAAVEASNATRKQAEDMAAVVVTLGERLEKFMDTTRRELAKQREEHDATLRAIAGKLSEVEGKLDAEPYADKVASNGSKKELQASLAAIKEKLAEHARNIVTLRGALNDMNAAAPGAEGGAALGAAAPAAAGAAPEKKPPKPEHPIRNVVALRAVVGDANVPTIAGADDSGAAAAAASDATPAAPEKKTPKAKKATPAKDGAKTPKAEDATKTPKPEDFDLEVAPEAAVVVA
jgi:hypothetical protein